MNEFVLVDVLPPPNCSVIFELYLDDSVPGDLEVLLELGVVPFALVLAQPLFLFLFNCLAFALKLPNWHTAYYETILLKPNQQTPLSEVILANIHFVVSMIDEREISTGTP